MSAPPAQPPEQTPTGAHDGTARSQLLVDRLMPHYDLAVVHAQVFRASPAACFRAARGVDLFAAPLIRTLLDLRGMAERLVGTLRGRPQGRAPGTPRRKFQLEDMAGLGWILLGETPGVEFVLGQVSRPWKPGAISTGTPVTAEQFAGFDQPGFARIATSLRVDPYGSRSSILTMETRVALTDDASRRRFRRCWTLAGPFSHLIRRFALRLLAAELRRSAPSRPGDGGFAWRNP